MWKVNRGNSEVSSHLKIKSCISSSLKVRFAVPCAQIRILGICLKLRIYGETDRVIWDPQLSLHVGLSLED